MNFSPFFDISWGAALVFLGQKAFPYVVIWTLLSEAYTLYRLKFYESFGSCLKNSIVINLVSGLVGLIWQFLFFDIRGYMDWFDNLVAAFHISNWGTFLFFAVLCLLVVDWIGSILLESLVLMIMQFGQNNLSDITPLKGKQIAIHAIKVSAIINTVSYIGITIGMFLWLYS